MNLANTNSIIFVEVGLGRLGKGIVFERVNQFNGTTLNMLAADANQNFSKKPLI